MTVPAGVLRLTGSPAPKVSRDNWVAVPPKPTVRGGLVKVTLVMPVSGVPAGLLTESRTEG